jgi:GT2 family glycosyltransferase
VGGASFHVGGSEGPADTVYLGTFLRSAIEAVNGFDPHFIRAQDWELNHRLRANGGLIYFNPRLQVTYRPRPTLRKLARQYFEYGRWRREVTRNHKGTLNLRYLAPPLTLIGSAFGLLAAILNPWFLLLPALYFFFNLIGSIMLILKKPAPEMFLLPIILATMHSAWAWGFIASTKQGTNAR